MLKILLANNHFPDIIIISETWLSPDNSKSKLSSINIDGYSFLSKPRDWGRGGGIGIYIKDSLNFTICHKFSSNLSNKFEHLIIKVKGKNSKSNCIISGLYRPPNLDSNVWLKNFEKLYCNILSDKCSNLVFAGDLNYNLLDSSHPLTANFNNTINMLNLYQTITAPTRITASSISLLDLFLVTNKQSIIDSNILTDNPLTDHHGTYLIIKTKPQRLLPTIKTFRDTKNFKPELFLECLNNQPFHLIYESCNPNTMLSKLNSYILNALNKYAPIKKVKVCKPPTPWITNIIKKLIHKKNLLYQKAKSNNSESITAKFSILNRYTKQTIKQAKQDFINKCLYNSNNKNAWNVINRLLKPSPKPILHDLNNLNQHFISTSQRVLGHQPQPATLPSSTGSFCFQRTTIDQVLKIILNLKTNCATGPDQIPANFIKLSAPTIAPHLTNIINTCIQSDIFPDEWKVSRVSPVPKIDSPSSLDDYRPISILPILSKVLEKILVNQIISHINTSQLYPSTLSGCRTGHSTATSLLYIRDTCIKALNSNKLSILSLVDFSKAFDTLNYSTLLKILVKYNFSSSAIRLLHSYLSNRKQYTQYCSMISSTSSVVSGVPQGSLLGPILFNLYVISINQKISSIDPLTTCLNYVDDFQIVHQDKPDNIIALSQQIKFSLEYLKSAATNLDLSLNSTKTKYIVISTKHMTKKYNLATAIPEISIDSSIIERTNCHKNLGVYFDQHLNFNYHHSQTIRKAYAILRSLNTLKYNLSTDVKLKLIDSLIFSRLTYANVVTFPCTKFWLSKYNKVFKVALSFAFNTYISSNKACSINILNIESRWKLYLLTLVYKCLYFPQFPTYLNLLLKQKQSRNLRSSLAPLLAVHSTNYKTFQDLATPLFNSLPIEIRLIQGATNLNVFKIKVKSFLLTNQQNN